MKRIIISFFLLIAVTGSSLSQLDDILKNVPGVGDIFIDEAVTTSIKDAYSQALWLNELDKKVSYDQNTGFNLNLGAGYYRYKFNTFCLHAGTYQPTEGSGYLVAPLKGSKADLIKSILGRYYEHPEVEQKDVQLLLWGIEAGQKFSSYPADFQVRVTPLLKPDEIALMEVDIKDVSYDLLPQEAKDILNTYKDLRGKLSDANATYEDVERISVKTGIAPKGKGSKNIEAGTWTSIGDGVFMRSFPNGYAKSEVEIYIPAVTKIEKDLKGSISLLDDGRNSLNIEYDAGGVIKQVSLKNNSSGEMQVIDNGSNDLTMQKNSSGELISLIKKSFGKKRSKNITASVVKDIESLKTIESFVSSSTAGDNAKMLTLNALFNYVSDLEAKTKNKKGGSNNHKAGLSNLAGLVFAPANTSQQRLGNGGPEGGNGNTGNGNEGNNGNNENNGNTGNNNGNNGNNNGNNGNNNQGNNEEDEKKKKEEEEKKKKCNNTIPNISTYFQETKNTCWAATSASMLNYRDNKHYVVDDVLKMLGPEYKELYKGDFVLPKTKLDDFMNKLGMVGESNQFPITNIPDILKEKGPVIVLSDVSGPDEDFLLHARIIYGVEGDCSFSGSKFKIIDPDAATNENGKYELSYNDLTNQIAKYVDKSSEGKYPYILHFK